MKKIAIIIPTYNRRNELKHLLTCLANQHACDAELQVIVVNDGSKDGTQEMLAESFPDVSVIHGDGFWWYTKSINKGFQFASNYSPDYILTLNDDVFLSMDYILKLMKNACEVKEDCILGSISLTAELPHRFTFSGIKKINKLIDKTIAYFPYLSAFNGQAKYSILPSVVLPGRGLLIPFFMMQKLNGFDDKFFQYQSDYDFCLRAAKIGYRSYVSFEAVVYSHEKQTSSTSTSLKPAFRQIVGSLFLKQTRYYLPNRSRYYWKHFYKWLWPMYMTKYIFSILAKSRIFSP